MNTVRSLFVSFVLKSLLVLWISIGGVAVYASADATAEDLIVLSELSKAQASATAQDQTDSLVAQSTTSNRPAIASDKLILNSPIIDEAYVLTASEKAHLEAQLRKIYDDNLAQMAIVIVPTTDGMPIFDYALATAQRWGLGQKDTDEGILMLVAINDRQIYTVTGYGVEGVLPDAFLKRITREDITPAFKSGQYAQGLSVGIARIDERLRADPDTLARADKEAAETDDPADVLLFVFFFVVALVVGPILSSIFGRFIGSSIGAMGFMASAVMMGASFFGALFLSFILWLMLLSGGINRNIIINSHGSGGGFGGSSGGGFGGGGGGFSGGGGGFGGGGAGGSW